MARHKSWHDATRYLIRYKTSPVLGLRTDHSTANPTHSKMGKLARRDLKAEAADSFTLLVLLNIEG